MTIIEVKHALRHYRVESGLHNCHAFGVESLVLRTNRDGSLIRIFHATGTHTLQRLFRDNGHFVVGVHNHNKALRLRRLFGDIWNVELRPTSTPEASCLYRYPFTSALNNPDGFNLGKPVIRRMSITTRRLIDVAMRPHDTHTVLVPASTAAWLVEEGPTVPNFQKYIYSPKSDLSLNSVGLYIPMNPRHLHLTCDAILEALQPTIRYDNPLEAA